ncbi:MAG TPA: RNA-binding protein [Phycisphaerae bacterium]|nr:RNA-binding protein [Phycisphaerae bacterium]HPS52588.1 RNA-binding protein [Phycisphaerae bacterium]
MNIYVGNLSYRVNDDELRSFFEQFGEVSSAKVVMDRETGRSRGFGFVEMPNDEEGKDAIAKSNEKELQGRALKVNEARPREEKPRRNFNN